MGLFNTVAPQGVIFREKARRQSGETMDRFADLLADGVEPETAATMLGKHPAYGRALLQRIRKRLGDQAR